MKSPESETLSLTTLETAVEEVSELLERLETMPGFDAVQIEAWTQRCRRIPTLVSAGIIRVAVVGAIKSGKSTFINSLLGADLLRRGAGVITSIITRLRRAGDCLAVLRMKSWDEINQEIEKALVLFPDLGSAEPAAGSFDIRRRKDREQLRKVSHWLRSTLSVQDTGIQPEAMVIANACSGYDAVSTLVQADPEDLVFTADEFERHKDFTGNESAAFFVRDVRLDVTSENLMESVELADCQGSDSPDASHLSRILEYLVAANLIIYIISSRTGLREADVRFLSRLHFMGLMENLIFVVNVDLSEHESLEDLKRVEDRIRDQLGYLASDTTVYSFSSLFELFSTMGDQLSRKDRQRLDQWLDDRELVDYTTDMQCRFNSHLDQVLTKERTRLLVSNPLEQLTRILESVQKRIRTVQELLTENKTTERRREQDLAEMAERSRRIETIMKHSLAGALDGIKSEMEAGLASFFDSRKGSLVPHVKSFIHNHRFDDSRYEREMALSGLSSAVYLMFQDFHAALDAFMVEEIFPEIVAFVRKQEAGMESYFQSLYRSCSIDLSTFQGTIPDFRSRTGTKSAPQENQASLIDVRFIRQILGLTIPAVSFSCRFTARIKVETIAQKGIRSIWQVLAVVFKNRASLPESLALERAAGRIRSEAVRSISASLAKTCEALRNDYLMPLLNAVSRDFEEKLMDRFQVYGKELDAITGMLSGRASEKAFQEQELDDIHRKLTRLELQVSQLSLTCQQ